MDAEPLQSSGRSIWTTSMATVPVASSDGLRAITVAGFKSIRNPIRVEFGSLTVLAGANSSGKSSLIQPLLVLKQTLDATYNPAKLKLDGPNIHFSEARQMFSAGLASSRILLGFDFANNTVELDYLLDPGLRLRFGTTSHRDGTNTTLLSDSIPEAELDRMARSIIRSSGQPWPNEIYNAFLIQDRVGWALYAHAGVEGEVSSVPAFQLRPTRLVARAASELIHIPGLRGNPMRDYPIAALGETFPGTFDSYVASVIRHWQDTADSRLDDLSKQLVQLGLTHGVSVEHIDDVRVQIKVGRLPTAAPARSDDWVSVADVGFGVSQILPVLVALLVAQAHQMIYIEQPEIHLHPRAQRALAAPLIAAANRGVRVVIETHSNILLTEIQTQVARGDLIDPADVKLHWLDRDVNGDSRLTTAELDSSGAYGDWPADFDETFAAAQDDYIAAAMARLGQVSTAAR